MDFESVLLSRKSCRSFINKEVEKDKLDKVVTSASLSPLGLPSHGKPIINVITSVDKLALLNNYYNAPVLIIVSCPSYPASGLDHQNAACIVEMMSLMATSLGLSSIYLYGVTHDLWDNDEIKKELGIKVGYKPLAALALGYSEEGVKIVKEFNSTLDVIYK